MQNCISGDVNLGEHIISESLKFCAAINKEKPSEINRFQRVFGPSGATRTRGLDIPNVACYQLHYTRIFACHDYSTKLVQIKVFPVCSHLCGQSGFWPGFAARKNPANACVTRGSGLWLFPSWIDGKPLPKQARYQLRYTRLLSCFIRLGVFSQMSRATNCATPGYSVCLSGWAYSPKPPPLPIALIPDICVSSL